MVLVVDLFLVRWLIVVVTGLIVVVTWLIVVVMGLLELFQVGDAIVVVAQVLLLEKIPHRLHFLQRMHHRLLMKIIHAHLRLVNSHPDFCQFLLLTRSLLISHH